MLQSMARDNETHHAHIVSVEENLGKLFLVSRVITSSMSVTELSCNRAASNREDLQLRDVLENHI
jgi:hypothetical protein